MFELLRRRRGDERHTPRAEAPRKGPGFDGRTITVGAIAPLTGPSAPLAESTLAGNRLYWEQLNADGGIAGRYRVRFEPVDGEFFESVAVIRYDDVKDDLALVNDIFDAKAARALLPRLERDDLVAIAATDASDWVTKANLVPISASAQTRAINAISYWLDHGGRGRRLCALHQDDTYGPMGFDGVDFVAGELGVDLAAQPTFEPLATNLDEQVDDLAKARCDAVYFNGLGFQALLALRHAKAAGFEPRWIASATSWDPSLAEAADLADYLGKNYWVLGNGPAWGDRSSGSAP